ncbi:hypothetical protein F4859DRAFT_74079 [Xylaria cf. heliscus]|nr:hypothetical protein F4859DRAFT_74079 [Xylaria cf. heliscus]
MATQADTPEVPAPKVGIPEMANFLSLLSALAADPSITWMEKVVEDNNAMRAAVAKRDIECKGFIHAIAKVSENHKIEAEKSERAVTESEEAKKKAGELVTEMEHAKKTIAEKDQKLQEDGATITKLQGNVEDLDKEVNARNEVIKKQEEQHANDGARIKGLENELETTKGELDTTTNQLKELQDLSCKIIDGSREEVLTVINKIYFVAKKIAVAYFGEDLPEDILSNTPLFDEIRKLVRPIPFPSSNSLAAKKARIAAFLASLGSRLADQIFLPYYIKPDYEEEQHSLDAITIFLSNLSHSDPKRELHLRSVLLAISPDEQRKIALERADRIADDMFNLLGILLGDELQTRFDHDVSKLCQMAVEIWDTLRPLKEKVEPFTMTEEDNDNKYWLPAELDGASPSKKQVNGKPNGLTSKPSMQSLKSTNKVILVWPGFSYGSEVLKQGFMLLDSQVKTAGDEDAPTPKRNLRAMQRMATFSSVQGRISTSRKSKILSPRPEN